MTAHAVVIIGNSNGVVDDLNMSDRKKKRA